MWASPFTAQQSPYQNVDVMRHQLESQLSQVNKVSQSVNPLQELQSITSNLSEDERRVLFENNAFLHAKQIYELSFIDFLLGKFAQEYLNTPAGQESLKNLIDITKTSIGDIKKTSKEKTDKLNAIAELMDKDPEIQKLIFEKIKK